jgi:hypothetical protein
MVSSLLAELWVVRSNPASVGMGVAFYMKIGTHKPLNSKIKLRPQAPEHMCALTHM